MVGLLKTEKKEQILKEEFLHNFKESLENKEKNDIEKIFPEFKIQEKIIYKKEENLQIKKNPKLEKDDYLYQNSQKCSENPKENFVNLKIFPIFYFLFSCFFLIFVFIYEEKYSLKKEEKYLKIFNSKFFVLDFFKFFEVNKLLYQIFFIYITIFGFFIVYFVSYKIKEINKNLSEEKKSNKSFIYLIFTFGIISNFSKLFSCVIFLNKNFENFNKKIKKNYSLSVHEFLFYVEIYSTLIFGFLILFFLKRNKLYEKFEEKNDNNNNNICNNCNEENRLEIKNDKISDDEETEFNSKNKIILITSKLNLNRSFNSTENLLKKCNNETKFDLKNEKNEKNNKNNEKIDIIWVKYKIFTLVYLSFFLITFHFLKFVRIFNSGFFIEKINMANTNNIEYNNDDVVIDFNYFWVIFVIFTDFLISVLPYLIYLLNAFFYLLNYGILKNSESIL